jgi:hypothetical protein
MIKFLIKWYQSAFKNGKDIQEGLKAAEKQPGLVDKKAGMTAYSQAPDETNKEIMRRMKSVHINLKYRLIYPASWILKKFTKKHYKGIPNTAHNRNLMVFDRAFEKAIVEWNTKSLAHAYNYPITQSKKTWLKNAEIGSSDLLRTAKEAGLMFALTDTAYRNFLDILMYEITLEMQKEHANDPAGHPQHLIYNSKNISQPEYFFLHQCSVTKDLSMYREDDRTCCERQAIIEAAKVLAEGRTKEVIEKAEELRAGGMRFANADALIQTLEQMKDDPDLAKEVVSEIKKQG